MEFCEAITKHSDQNKMDLTNIAMVIAPNLFFSLPSLRGFDDVAMAANTTHIVRLLIKYHDLLWTVSGVGGGLSGISMSSEEGRV